MTAAAPKGRTTRAAQAAETRQRLIDAAVEAFSAQSYEEVAVADIAKTAGVAHGLLFHYFGNKRGIYLEAMRDASDRIVRVQQSDPHLPAAEQIRAGLNAHFRYLAAHRGLALRLVLSGRATDPETAEAFEAGRWRAIEKWTTLLGLDPENPALRMMMRSTIGALDEATVYWLQNDEPFDVKHMVDCILEMTVAGLRAAAMLDPELDVTAAASMLLEAGRTP
ncbi:TetR/AcrR family transcriptional regulator [Nocardia gipuzkoensis]|uniref:TetR/AcrR family transcriptional regulator n=1 Tax=Nocardia gipuzkoensis TaxID=2749991 RepID=UPI001E569014|nr:TetR/AcrR family transcriptional regulator [Nocardia gipuzkoensis]UGT67883.1 TetR/AcrR family transcriptional regulator [Nocardia gipuzkoensis]